MPANSRAADATLLPNVNVTTAQRERLRRRVATAVTALAAFVAVLVASVVSVLLGFLT
jgi:type VI protein secretion system component VasF